MKISANISRRGSYFCFAAQTSNDAIRRPKVGSTIQDQDLMSHQDRLGNNGPEATGLTKPDDGDDRVQKKSKNVAHAPDGIKLKMLKNSGCLRNSPTTGSADQK